MKSCSITSEQLSAYVDDELDTATRAIVDEHIQSCAECRELLDDYMFVAGLYRSVPEAELPPNFKAELHEKLVGEKQKLGLHRSKPLLQNKYLKICSTIAAVFIIMLLLKGFTGNGFLIQPSRQQKTAAQESAGKAAASLADTAAAPERKLDEAEKPVQAKAAAAAQAQSPAAPKPSEPARSGEERMTIMSADAAKQKANSASENTVAITVRAANSTENTGNIKQYATANSAELPAVADIAPRMQLKSAMSAAQAAPSASPAPEVSSSADMDNSVTFRIPSANYQAFLDALKQGFGASSVAAEDVKSKDLTGSIDQLNKNLAEIESKLDGLQKNGSSQTEEPDRLKAEREAIMAELERLQLDSDYIHVTVTLQQ